nr:helix-turn-helix domain-containing protein [Nocardia bovistercoris]
MGTVAAVFGRRPGLPNFDVVVCTAKPGWVSTDLGMPVRIDRGVDALATAELVLVLPGTQFRDTDPVVCRALNDAYGRGAILAANCTGVFVLAATGLLDGREVTTHWQFADELAATHPGVRVRPDALYLDHGRVVTGAGAAAGLDLYLHLVRREHGGIVANEIARGLVTPPHRSGDQAQYITAPIARSGDDARIEAVTAWAQQNLHVISTVDDLAARALMSRRTFARRFAAATGTTPKAWLLTRRLDYAADLLESTDLSVEEIAHRVGYRTAAVFREQFATRRGTAPRDYRRTFSRS